MSTRIEVIAGLVELCESCGTKHPRHVTTTHNDLPALEAMREALTAIQMIVHAALALAEKVSR